MIVPGIQNWTKFNVLHDKMFNAWLLFWGVGLLVYRLIVWSNTHTSLSRAEASFKGRAGDWECLSRDWQVEEKLWPTDYNVESVPCWVTLTKGSSETCSQSHWHGQIWWRGEFSCRSAMERRVCTFRPRRQRIFKRNWAPLMVFRLRSLQHLESRGSGFFVTVCFQYKICCTTLSSDSGS